MLECLPDASNPGKDKSLKMQNIDKKLCRAFLATTLSIQGSFD